MDFSSFFADMNQFSGFCRAFHFILPFRTQKWLERIKKLHPLIVSAACQFTHQRQQALDCLRVDLPQQITQISDIPQISETRRISAGRRRILRGRGRI